MSDANDIVQRGLGGDDAAQADLTTAIGTDAGVNVNKQIPIALAASQAGC
jgi:Tfp pilus assembly PilM family ATPase